MRQSKYLHFSIFIFCALITLLFGVITTAGQAAPTAERVLVLGIDGTDFGLINKWMAEGKLPNFQRLRDRGSFRPLQSSIPPQSPVAWSNFITGTNPGGHAIYDFVHRNPTTYLPFSAMSEVLPPDEQTSFLGMKLPNQISVPGSCYTIPLSGGTTNNLRQGTAFWDILTDHGVNAVVHRIPVNFPPVGSKATTLSGMGTPDVQGTSGEYAYYTTAPPLAYETATGGKIFPVQVVNGSVQNKLYGPPNDFINYDKLQRQLARRIDYQEHKASIPFTVYIDEENPVAKIIIDGQEIWLDEGVFSPWIELNFSLLPSPGLISWFHRDLVGVKGIVRFYLKQAHPDFSLYVTPIQISPMNPALPISTPPEYASELAEAIGPYYTQGMPQDTKALDMDVFSNADFMKQAQIILDEEMAMAEYEIDRFDDGFLFLYFTAIDQIGHMMWRTMVGEDHPAYDKELDESFHDVIPGLYQHFDTYLGRLLDDLDQNTCLIVMSDHGFASWTRAFNLNRWLYDNQYLAIKPGTSIHDIEYLIGVDWNNTTAYGLGINGLHINQMGRERFGTVPPGPAKDQIISDLIEKLEAYIDPVTGLHPVLNAYRGTDVYSGPYLDQAPDIQLGYNRGYRVSDESAIGEISTTVVQDNLRRWSGDHCADYSLVPGVLFTNFNVRAPEPALYDLAPTILSLFSIQPPAEMDGQPIF